MLTINHLLLQMANNRRQYLDTELERIRGICNSRICATLDWCLDWPAPLSWPPFINYLVASLLDRSWSLVIDLFLDKAHCYCTSCSLPFVVCLSTMAGFCCLTIKYEMFSFVCLWLILCLVGRQWGSGKFLAARRML